MKQSEAQLHSQVCQYIKAQYPNVIFNSDMSGVKLTKGQAIKAAKLRSDKGFPDLVIYDSRGGYNALFIELKAYGVRVLKKDRTPATPHIAEQIKMIKDLRACGYSASICIGFEQAKEAIDFYMNLD